MLLLARINMQPWAPTKQKVKQNRQETTPPWKEPNGHEKKTHRPHSSKITLLPSKQVVDNITEARSFLVN